MAPRTDGTNSTPASPRPIRSTRPTANRSQSDAPATTERTSLLRTSHSQGRLASTEEESAPRRRGKWTSTLKRKSAAVSDLLSGHSHSAWTLPIGAGGSEARDSGESDLEEIEGELAARRGAKGVGYDGEFRQELEGEGGNGVRQWYDNFHSIDWIHDSIKHSLRMRRLRTRKRTEGIRGWIANLWDGSQGWLLVTIVGFLAACIAYLIISGEMLLFDYKEGYCVNNPRLPKRFCCRVREPVHTSSSPFFNLANLSAQGAVSGTSFLRGWSASAANEGRSEPCKDWRTWGEVWSGSPASGGAEEDSWLVNYLAFIAIALIFSTTASTLTIYLSSSTSVYSSKDSPSVPHPGFSPDFPQPHHAAESSTGSTEYGSTNVAGTLETNLLPKVEGGKLVLPLPRPRKVMYFAAGSGIPEIKTILSGFVIRGYLGSWTLATKSIGLALSVASGLSLGKEGPFVHIASCVGNIASRFFPKYDRNEAKRREIISAACAAGVAVSFGAPVGGTLFSLEEVSFFFPPRVMWRSFWCAMIAAMTLKLLDPFGSGKIVLFAVTYDRDWNTFELWGFLGLGIFGGVYGALFCKANIWWTRNVRNGTFLKRHPILEVALITLVTVFVSFYNPFTKMGGTELVYELFSECHIGDSSNGLCVDDPELVWRLVSSIGFALVVKALLTVATFGIKLPAGIFIPTLAVGACAGRIAGLLVELLHARHPILGIFDACRLANEDGPLPFGQACVLPGVWAMVGAAASLAGVTRTTVSLAVIMFELTGTLSYTVPVMLAVLVAKTCADAIEPRSIYDLVIELSDLPYLDAKVDYVHESGPSDIMDMDAPTISLDKDNTVESLRIQLAKLYDEGSGGGFPIVAKEDGGLRMYGYIAAKELEHGLASAAMQPSSTPCTFRTAASLQSGVPLPASRAATPSSVDFSWLIETAPIVVNQRSPMELCHEMFSKLGVRYLICVDERGFYKAVIEKNRYLAYLRWLERVKEEGRWSSKKMVMPEA